MKSQAQQKRLLSASLILVLFTVGASSAYIEERVLALEEAIRNLQSTNSCNPCQRIATLSNTVGSLQGSLNSNSQTINQVQNNLSQLAGSIPKTYSGEVGPSGWQTYLGSEPGIFYDVDFSNLNLTKVPRVFTSLTGTTNHWMITGMTSIYNLTNKGFRVYILALKEPLTPAIALARQYKLEYLLIA